MNEAVEQKLPGIQPKIIQIAATRYTDDIGGGTALFGLDVEGNLWSLYLREEAGWCLRVRHEDARYGRYAVTT